MIPHRYGDPVQDHPRILPGLPHEQGQMDHHPAGRIIGEERYYSIAGYELYDDRGKGPEGEACS